MAKEGIKDITEDNEGDYKRYEQDCEGNGRGSTRNQRDYTETEGNATGSKAITKGTIGITKEFQGLR